MTLPRRKIQFLLMAVVFGALIVSSRPAYADTYNFTAFNYPGGSHTIALGINDNGDIFGTVGEPFDTGFLYQNGNYSLFPGIVDVNNNGMILFNSPSGPALFFNGQVTPLNVPGSLVAFNNNGTVLVTGGFVKDGVFHPVNYPGSVSTTVSGINDLDEVVGSYFVSGSGNSHGFLYKNGVYTTIDFPGAVFSNNACAINNNGQIVGDRHTALMQLTDGHGPDVVIEAIGLPQIFRTAVEEVAFAGRVVFIGYAKELVSYESRLFVQKELDILGSRNALPADFHEVIAMLEAGRFPVEKSISKIVPLEEAPDALTEWSADPSCFQKIMVQVNTNS